jgi:hypothetical protein
LLVLVIVLIFFQFIISYIHKISLQDLLNHTQEWYKKDSAEKMANLTATSLELLLETSSIDDQMDAESEKNLVQAFNIILNQELLQQNIEEICILIMAGDSVHAIDDGQALYNYLYRDSVHVADPDVPHPGAVILYRNLESNLRFNEQIVSYPYEEKGLQVFVPLAPKGEYAGAVFIKMEPDLSFISHQLISTYDETALIFSALILFGLLAMFYISSYTVKERDEAQQQLFQERENYLRAHIHHEKESQFTKRIYHTHHKAEKIMGFIKEDLRQIDASNLEAMKYRMNKYANYISRVIYDMKWYDPPLQTIRNPLFKTNLNEVLQFIIDAIFLRTSNDVRRVKFELRKDEAMPVVPINEFVVWEIVEPLIHNSLDHSQGQEITVQIGARYDAQAKKGVVFIRDNGCGITPHLLEANEDGVKRLFLEHMSTKPDGKNSGYGCYLSYEIAKRCGWKLDAENLPEGGCRFTLSIVNI